MNLVDALLCELKDMGVQHLYGIPGDFVLPLFEQLQQKNQLPLVYLSHEPAAVFAADAAARISNRPAAVILTYGAGALNAVNAVAQAYVEHVPLLVIAGYPAKAEKERQLLIHHQARRFDSQKKIFEEITACQVRLDDPATAWQQLQHACRLCQQESLPVLIEWPRDAANFPVAERPRLPRRKVDEAQLELAAQAMQQRLAAAKKPVLLVDVDVRRFAAVEQVEQLAQSCQIPILTTLLGRAAVDQTHPYYRGIFLDQADSESFALIEQADLIIQLGVLPTDSNFAAHQHLFQADRVLDVQQQGCRIGEQFYVGFGIRDLLIALSAMKLPVFNLSTKVARSLDVPAEPDASKALDPIRLMQCLHRELSAQPATLPMVADIGDCLFASLQAAPSLLLAPAFYASMGYAVPAAIGVQLTSGLRPVVLVGDGAFRMTGLELGHCQRYGVSPIVVLFNNSNWEMIKAFAPKLDCANLGQWHYAELAEAMGMLGLVADDEASLSQAIRLALARPEQPVLIEARYQAGQQSQQLSRFARRFLGC
ncbi:thiamine pyrophosphate-binding protein [Alkalimonas delamerensis]|uniref:Thiamine pyrophosphate-binding protein n=1 Tax=Alkalimonas delamerensis TaxID=265981 RepID=A0ABT9GNA1_9GAMM|nr:thiamine pyrophosphate-binding protein [Alkalimonas delamerensis]MDP4528457.1 thiamine pyrophosphate-binding protein [Alkalimonas delamerensis]